MHIVLLNILLIAFLFVFFYFLGKSAELIVINTRRLGRKIGLDMYFLGLIIGLFTTLPEFTVGINSIINNIEEVSFGNLFGGTIVVLGLVLGMNAVLNKKIKTNGHGNNFIFILLYLLVPILLGLDSQFGIIDGSILIIMYLFLMYRLYRTEKDETKVKQVTHVKKKIYMNLFWIITGVTGLIIFSTLIVRTTELVLSEVGISTFVVGTIIFALGTNLPEISISLKSLQNHTKELSYSSLLGSAAANPFIIGLMSFIQPLSFEIGTSYFIMATFSIILFVVLYFFYRSGNIFSRKEGIVLIWIYILFVSFEILSQVYH